MINEGKIQGLRYDELASMLLSEMQKQQGVIAAQNQHVAEQDAKISQLENQLAEIRAALVERPSRDGRVAQR
jgi:phage shock protein A